MSLEHTGPISTSNLLAAAACYRESYDAFIAAFNEDPTSERTRQLQEAKKQVADTFLKMALRVEAAQ